MKELSEQQVNLLKKLIPILSGIECFTKTHNIDGKNYLIKIWDTCGQERFRSLTANYYKNSDGIILVFDISNPESFLNLDNWINSIYKQKDEKFPKIIICNKIDLENKVNQLQIKNFSKKYQTTIFQSSVKNSVNIIPAFDQLIKSIIKEKNKKEIDERITLNVNSNFHYDRYCKC